MQLQLKGMDVLRQDILCFNRRQSILQEGHTTSVSNRAKQCKREICNKWCGIDDICNSKKMKRH